MVELLAKLGKLAKWPAEGTTGTVYYSPTNSFTLTNGLIFHSFHSNHLVVNGLPSYKFLIFANYSASVVIDRNSQILRSTFLKLEITPQTIENIETFSYPHNSSTAGIEN